MANKHNSLSYTKWLCKYHLHLSIDEKYNIININESISQNLYIF